MSWEYLRLTLPIDAGRLEDDTPAVPKPLAAAKVDAWRRYAESLGIDPKGRSKDELRSLCAQRESQS